MKSPSKAQPVSKDIPMLALRASVGTIDEDTRTVELVFSTGAPVERYDWWTGKRFIEKLSLKPAHIRLDRLNSGAPLLNTHSAYSLDDQIGVVVDGSARLTKTEAGATVRFARTDDVENIWQKVKDRIVRNVSVGYRVHKFEEDAGDNKIPVRTAIDWEPYEISMVPMPADCGAQTRDTDQQSLNPCVLVTRAVSQETPSMADTNTSAAESIVERDPLDPGAPLTTAAKPAASAPAETDATRAADQERDRIEGIMAGCRAALIPAELMDKMIKDKTPLVDAQRQIFAELQRRGYDQAGPQHTAAQRPDIRMTDDTMVHLRAGMVNGLLHRLSPQHFKLEDVGRSYRGLNMLGLAEMFLRARGIRTTNLSKMEIAGLALGLRGGIGQHSTSDFADILGDVANKSLRKAYDEAPHRWQALATPRTFTDFKPVNLVQLGDAPGLEEIGEGGEYTSGTISDGKEVAQLVTYGRKFAITRKAIINDDTDAFSRLPMMFGRRARAKESDLVWAQLTGNPVMADGNELFSAAHSNLAAVGTAIDISSLGAGRASLRKQTSLDGQYMNLEARYLLVGPNQETLADQYVTAITANAGSSVNPFAGKLTVIAEPRFETADYGAWWLAASPEQLDMIVYGYLDGQEGPMVESMVDVDVDGVTVRCRLDFAAKVVDHRGFYKNEGTS